jgi:hypothetical protein
MSDSGAFNSSVDGRVMNRPPNRFVDLRSAVGLLYDVQLGRLLSGDGIPANEIGVPDDDFLRRTFLDGMSLYDVLNGGGGPIPEYDARNPADLPTGPSWFRVNAYERPGSPPGVGISVDYNAKPPGTAGSFRLSSTLGLDVQMIGPPGIEMIHMVTGFGPDVATVTEIDTGKVLVRFLLDFPSDMDEGERRPAQA